MQETKVGRRVALPSPVEEEEWEGLEEITLRPEEEVGQNEEGEEGGLSPP